MQVMTESRKLLGELLIGQSSGGDLQPSPYFSLFNSMHNKMLEIFSDVAVTGAHLKTSLICWSLKQHVGDFATMSFIVAQYGLGKFP